MKRSYITTLFAILAAAFAAVAQPSGSSVILTVDTDNDGIYDIDDIDDDNDGIVDILEICGEFGSMTALTQLTVVIGTDSDPGATSWEIEGSGGHLAHGGPYTLPNTEYTHEIEIDQFGSYWFAIDDSEGNGLESQGYFRLYLNGQLVHDGDGNFSWAEVVGFESYEAFLSCISSDPSGDDDNDGIINYRDSDYCSLNAKGVCRDMDADKDGIPNFLDLDSDNDALTDLVESQLTLAYYTLYGVDADHDGLDDAFDAVIQSGMPVEETAMIAPADTDGDGIFDFLDSDSDNDGLFDDLESGFTRLHQDNDNDGLDDAADAAPGYARPEGRIYDPALLPDADADVFTGGDVDYRDMADGNVAETEEVRLESNTMEVYPNPAFSGQDVRVAGTDRFEGLWRLISMDGQTVAADDLNGSDAIALGREDLKQGVYILTIGEGDNQQSTKLIITK